MRVLTTFPPLYREINAKFNVRGRPVIFTFGDTIHNPSKIKIPPELMVHEAVHSHRQGDDPEGWWASYLADPEFRLTEEVPAHIAEYRDVCGRMTGKPRASALHRIASRLSSPLYDNLISYHEARRLVTAETEE